MSPIGIFMHLCHRGDSPPADITRLRRRAGSNLVETFERRVAQSRHARSELFHVHAEIATTVNSSLLVDRKIGGRVYLTHSRRCSHPEANCWNRRHHHGNVRHRDS